MNAHNFCHPDALEARVAGHRDAENAKRNIKTSKIGEENQGQTENQPERHVTNNESRNREKTRRLAPNWAHHKVA